jgi:hypothetical protein
LVTLARVARRNWVETEGEGEAIGPGWNPPTGPTRFYPTSLARHRRRLPSHNQPCSMVRIIREGRGPVNRDGRSKRPQR